MQEGREDDHLLSLMLRHLVDVSYVLVATKQTAMRMIVIIIMQVRLMAGNVNRIAGVKDSEAAPSVRIIDGSESSKEPALDDRHLVIWMTTR